MGLVPLTPFAPAAGVIETSCRAAAGCSGLVAFAGPSDDTSDAWLPGDANATISTPAPMTSAAPLAVRAAPRLFGRVTLNDFQDRLSCGIFTYLPAMIAASGTIRIPTRRRPLTRYHNLTKIQGLNSGGKHNR